MSWLRVVVTVIVIIPLLAAVLMTARAEDNALTETQKQDGWILLFDGNSLDGWMTSSCQPSRTAVEDGAINPHQCGGYMMIHEKQWSDFVLSLDFKISSGCNSGIFWRTFPLAPLPGNDVGFNGFEVAIDDTTSAGYHDTGAIYDLVRPKQNAMKRVGLWNHFVLTCDHSRIGVELNGVEVTQMDLQEWSEPGLRPDGTSHKFGAALKDRPRSGYIGLQDHGSPCWFKNIKIRPIRTHPDEVAVGVKKQLFVDDHVVAKRTGVVRKLGPISKANDGSPVFTEGRFYGTVLHDRGLFRMWFRHSDGSGFGLAESPDGLTWRQRSEVTGIPFAGDVNLSVEIDHWDSNAAHRYMASFDASGMAAGLARSGDGSHWIPINDGEPVTHRAADTYNQLLWDPTAGFYRLNTRTDFGSGGGPGEIRGVRSMINPTPTAHPTDWHTVGEWQFDREGRDEHRRRQIYALTDWIHAGVHFALMTVYEWPGDASEGPQDHHRRHERDVMNLYIATSRDGERWDLQWVYAGKPFVARGPDGAFDNDMLMPASTVVTHDDRHWLYYCGWNERHGTEAVSYERQAAIGLATLRLDRFMALAATEKPGVILTRPFVLDGPTLEINADARGGRFVVEVCDAYGGPIAGFTQAEAVALDDVDALRLCPTWSGADGLTSLVGRTVRLRFQLTNTQLYAFQIQP